MKNNNVKVAKGKIGKNYGNGLMYNIDAKIVKHIAYIVFIAINIVSIPAFAQVTVNAGPPICALVGVINNDVVSGIAAICVVYVCCMSLFGQMPINMALKMIGVIVVLLNIPTATAIITPACTGGQLVIN